MARGEWCARHDRYFGNIVPCQDCQREAQERQSREQLRLVSYEEWLVNYHGCSAVDGKIGRYEGWSEYPHPGSTGTRQ